MVVQRKPKKPPLTDRCVFCGAKKVTKEHMYPEWLQEFIEPFEPCGNHLVSDASGAISPGRHHELPGDALSRTLRIACGDCNNGWMSRLQTRAKPLLSKLLMGDWSMPIAPEEQEILAIWATMTTMVGEYADLNTIGVTRADREFLRLNQKVPPGWYVWAGRVDFGWAHPANMNHFAGGAASMKRHVNAAEAFTWQTTGFTVGRLLLQTATFPFPINAEEWAKFEGMVVVHPGTGAALAPPAKVHDWQAFYDTTNSIVRSFGLPAFERPEPRQRIDKSPYRAEQASSP